MKDRPLDSLPVKKAFSESEAVSLTAAEFLSGHRYEKSLRAVLNIVLNILHAQNYTIKGQHFDHKGNSICLVQATKQSPYFGFVFDVVIRLIDEQDTCFVDMRCVSRYLNPDFGWGAYFIKNFMEALDKAILL